MAISAFARSRFQTLEDTGFARAKKLADLAIKTNTDSSGSPTARGYEQALAYIEPFIASSKESDALDAQRLIAGYGNSLSKLASKERDQNETVAAFKLQEIDSYFTSFDGDVGSFRSPASLIDTTSESLDSLVLGVINAIDEKEANGDSTDALHAYFNDLNKRADTMRDLRNKFEKGELTGKTLDGFGYYVDANPLDGSIRAAALLPVSLSPGDITKGYKRLEATADIGGALLPVYAPAQQDALGEYISRIGDATWSGGGQGALQAKDAQQSKSLFAEGQFSISDVSTFPVRKTSIERGSFGRGFIGRDTEGNPVESVFYRGIDNKLYSVDQAGIDRFKQDPLLSRKLDGYVAQFSPTEVKEIFKEAVPFAEDVIRRESKLTRLQEQAVAAETEANRLQGMGFFGQLREGFNMTAERGRAASEARRASFFESKNTPTPPEEPVVGDSTPDIIEQGKSFFRKAAGFFSGQTQ